MSLGRRSVSRQPALPASAGPRRTVAALVERCAVRPGRPPRVALKVVAARRAPHPIEQAARSAADSDRAHHRRARRRHGRQRCVCPPSTDSEAGRAGAAARGLRADVRDRRAPRDRGTVAQPAIVDVPLQPALSGLRREPLLSAVDRRRRSGRSTSASAREAAAPAHRSDLRRDRVRPRRRRRARR